LFSDICNTDVDIDICKYLNIDSISILLIQVYCWYINNYCTITAINKGQSWPIGGPFPTDHNSTGSYDASKSKMLTYDCMVTRSLTTAREPWLNDISLYTESDTQTQTNKQTETQT